MPLLRLGRARPLGQQPGNDATSLARPAWGLCSEAPGLGAAHGQVVLPEAGPGLSQLRSACSPAGRGAPPGFQGKGQALSLTPLHPLPLGEPLFYVIFSEALCSLPLRDFDNGGTLVEKRERSVRGCDGVDRLVHQPPGSACSGPRGPAISQSGFPQTPQVRERR